MENEVVKYENEVVIFDPWREANIYANSDMIPKYFRTPENCYVAIQLAREMGVTTFMLINNMHEIHGKIGIEAKLGIAMINRSGLYGPIDYVFSGAEGKDSWACHIETMRLADKIKIIGPVVSVQMAKDQGWWSKTGSFWPKMTQMMLSYRAATFFIRLHCPDVLFGMQIQDELRDIGPVPVQDIGESDGEREPERVTNPEPVEPAEESSLPERKPRKKEPEGNQTPDTEPPQPEFVPPKVCGHTGCAAYTETLASHCDNPSFHDKDDPGKACFLFENSVSSACPDTEFGLVGINRLLASIPKEKIEEAKKHLGIDKAVEAIDKWRLYYWIHKIEFPEWVKT